MFKFFKKNKTKKFTEKLNTAVFTTKFVIRENKPITYISHDLEDGAWQFFSDDDFENYEKVAMIVSLEQIIDKDKSVLEISDLPLGYVAIRKSGNDKWKVNRKE